MMKMDGIKIFLLLFLIHSIQALRIVYCNGRELRTSMDTSSIRCDSGSELAVLNTTCQLYCPETYDPQVQFFKCHLFGWFPTTDPKCSQNSSVTLMIVPAMLGSIAALFVISFSVAMYKRRQRRRQENGDDGDTEAGRNWKVKRRLHYLKTNPALAKDLCELREKTNKDVEVVTEEKTNENIDNDKKIRCDDNVEEDEKEKKTSRRFKIFRRHHKENPGGGGSKVSMWAKLKKNTRNRGKKLTNFRHRKPWWKRHKLRKRPPKQSNMTSSSASPDSSSSSSYTDCTTSDEESSSSYGSDNCSEEGKQQVQVQVETTEQVDEGEKEVVYAEPPPECAVSMTPSKTLEKAIIDKILIESVISKSEEPARDVKRYKPVASQKRKKKQVSTKQQQQGYDNYNTSAYNRQYHNFENDYRRKGEHYFDGRSYQPSHTVNTVKYYPINKPSSKKKKEKEKKVESTSSSQQQQRHGVKYFSIKPSKTNVKLEKYKGPSRYAPRVINGGNKEERSSKVRRVTRDKRDEEDSRRRRTDSKKRNDRDASKSRKRRQKRKDDDNSSVERQHSRSRNRKEKRRTSPKQRHHRSYRNKNYDDVSPPPPLPRQRHHRKDRHEDEGARRKRNHKRKSERKR